ncbi:Ion transport 2 domain protein [Paludibacter propionicigenes WB4]|uniref:Ion transport 2 domain protein n=1 Tax=Paludibacter propionicigenes (strain DSM 17365 / JCM 13257 / WB4) TaxID=694427 RepID=E4T3U3_PALPW|nr:ion transporter [Paludibacter propionicigenes]ADQ79387.1 Ion transport 2 domain protein [Paludibacter propionicigenes WB4]
MNRNNGNDKLRFFDIVIVVLSIYVLFALVIDSFFKLAPEVSKLLYLIDDLICVLFLYDFFYRFIKAPSKLKFMKWGWIDLISSIPTFEYLRYGRLIRLIRLFRILRAFRSVKYLTSHIFKTRTRGTFSTVSLISFLMLIFGSISILQVETVPESNIKTAGDAIWWSFVTITTVGYGDKFPVTGEGRVIAAFLMVTGVTLFGTFTGFIAAWFMGDKSNNKQS